MKFELPKLTYAFNDLEPYIDTATMEIHYTKHHAAYVNNLNTALEKYPELQSKALEELLASLETLPKEIQTAVRNNGGGHYNHTQYWNVLSPKGKGEPTGKIAEDINSAFGGFVNFKDAFNKAGLGRFGSGWVWLIRNPLSLLEIVSTPNQDAPIMEDKRVVFGIDVWEHAYYLKYQNKRADYLEAIWHVIDWNKIN